MFHLNDHFIIPILISWSIRFSAIRKIRILKSAKKVGLYNRHKDTSIIRFPFMLYVVDYGIGIT